MIGGVRKQCFHVPRGMYQTINKLIYKSKKREEKMFKLIDLLKLFTLILILILNLLSCSPTSDKVIDDDIVFPPKTERKYTHPTDMVLIYDGGVHRTIKWDKEHFAPYVSLEKEDKTHNWLFDGYLFLEITNGKGRGFASYYEKQGARKLEWKLLIDNYFTEDNAIIALNDRIEEVKQKVEEKTFKKRKIVLCLPEPIPNQKDWGEYDNRTLDFSKTEDRLVACKWYVDYAEEMFNKAGVNNIDLVGFYWIAEEATNSRFLAGSVASYIHKKGYNFYWIPYYFADGYSEWRALGFDQAYYQPNYFFNETTQLSQLEEACVRAKKNKMSLEMEFDDNALKKYGKGYRMTDYLRVFDKHKVWEAMDVAYYQGGDAFYKLYHSADQDDNKLHLALANIIAKRQKDITINKD